MKTTTCLQQILHNGYSSITSIFIKISGFSVYLPLHAFPPKSGSFFFLGRYTSNFTSSNQLFLTHPHIDRWKFEVTYSFDTETSSSALNFIINQPPSNGSCSISPINGTTTTLFTISCPDWFDQDGIKDYSLYSMSSALSPTITLLSVHFRSSESYVNHHVDRFLVSFNLFCLSTTGSRSITYSPAGDVDS